MNIVVCCKLIPCLQDMEVNPDGSVNFGRAQWQISDYDLQAIEAGVKLAKETGGKLTAVSVGGSKMDNSQLRKDLLSRGPDDLYLVMDDSLQDADTAQVSALLAEAVKKVGADLVLCGEGSADYYYQQTGMQVGERMDWACLNGVDKIEVAENGLVVDRVLEREVETLSVPLPAVLTVTSSINTPSRPNMRAVLAAGKKPVTVLAPEELGAATGAGMDVVSTLAPKTVERKAVIIESEAQEAVAELVRLLKTEQAL